MFDKVKIDIDYAKSAITKRPEDMHKGQAGHVLVIAGSLGMAGAAVLSVRGALHSGAGIVKASVVEDIFNILQILVPEAMCIRRGGVKEEAMDDFDAVAIGPGLGVNEENFMLVKDVLEQCRAAVVVDADALNCLARYGMESLLGRKGETIITPHPGEAVRLCRALDIDFNIAEREKSAVKLAKATGTVVLLKGAGTVVTDGERVLINSSGNPGMATGGSGDVLTGVIAGLSASGHLDLSTLGSAACGAFIHGLAGDIAREKKGEIGMTSMDIAECLPDAFRKIDFT